MSVVETVQRVTPLGVAFSDLLTDTAITDGLVVAARPSARSGPFRGAIATPKGVHVISDVPGLRDVEFPRPAPGRRVDVNDLPSGVGVDVDVVVEDRLRRFLPTVLRLEGPWRGIATAADALARCPALVWSVPADTPLFLMSSPERAIPPTTAVVRACLRHHATMEPAAHAVLIVEASGVRNVGVADAAGNVIVAFAYPALATTTAPSSVPAGSHGIPTTEQTWTVGAAVRWEPGTLSFPPGVGTPRIHSVLCQGAAAVFADDAGAPRPSVSADLAYGTPLVLSTDGPTDPARASYLFVEPPP